MTDKELCQFGERLYESVLLTPLPAATVFNLALAVRQAVPWSQLPQHLKFAVFKIAASCFEDAEGDQASTATDGQTTTPSEGPTPPGETDHAGESARAEPTPAPQPEAQPAPEAA